MKVTVFKEFRLYCAHSVASFGAGHKCARKHGHCYKVRVKVCRELDKETGVCIPFDEIESAWNSASEGLDHSDLNLFIGENATTESLAIYLAEKLSASLFGFSSIEIQETETSGVCLEL